MSLKLCPRGAWRICEGHASSPRRARHGGQVNRSKRNAELDGTQALQTKEHSFKVSLSSWSSSITVSTMSCGILLLSVTRLGVESERSVDVDLWKMRLGTRINPSGMSIRTSLEMDVRRL